MGFSRQEYWNGLPCPPPGDLHDPGIELASLMSPALAGWFCTTSATWDALHPTTGEAIPLRGLEGVPGLPGAPQDEAGLTRKFGTSHVGGATGLTPPIPRSALVSLLNSTTLSSKQPIGDHS